VEVVPICGGQVANTTGHELDRKWQVPKAMIGKRSSQAEPRSQVSVRVLKRGVNSRCQNLFCAAVGKTLGTATISSGHIKLGGPSGGRLTCAAGFPGNMLWAHRNEVCQNMTKRRPERQELEKLLPWHAANVRFVPGSYICVAANSTTIRSPRRRARPASLARRGRAP
jgi:hypothetical protein